MKLDVSLEGRHDSAGSWRLLFFLVVFLTPFAYFPGLSGPFLFDDEPNLKPIMNHPSEWRGSDILVALAGNDSGPLRRPVSIASFYAQKWALGDLTPFATKAINLCLHLLNGLLVTIALRRALAPCTPLPGVHPRFAAALPWLASAFWLVSPVHVSTVLYAVQRMTILSATFSLGFIILALIAIDHTVPARRRVVCALASLPAIGLAAFSKENGLLAPVLLLVLTALLPPPRRFRMRSTYRVLCAVSLLLAFGAICVVAIDLPARLLAGYANRPWSPCERLLTEGWVLLSYMAGFVVPHPGLHAFFWDDVTVLGCSVSSSAYWLVILVALASLLSLPSTRLAAVGFAWFLAGHSMESTILPLEIAFEHRNYLPSVGLALVVASAICHAASRWQVQGTLLASAIMLAAFLAALGLRSHGWRSEQAFVATQLAHRPQSALAHDMAGRLYASEWLATGDEQWFIAARAALRQASQLNPRMVAPIGSLALLEVHLGREIPEGVLKEMVRCVEAGPMQQSIPAQIQQYATEVIRLRPESASRSILPLYAAALNNSTVPERTRQVLLLSLAGVYGSSRDFRAANEILASLIAENPSHVETRLALVRTASGQGDRERLEAAIRDFESWAGSDGSSLRRAYLMRRLEIEFSGNASRRGAT